MRHVRGALTLCLVLIFAAPLAGQSLAELARAAEEARKASGGRPPAKVYTNKDLAPADQPPAPETKPATPSPPAAADRTASSTPTGGTPPPGSSDELYWRERMRPLLERLDAARTLADDTKRRADVLMRSADRCFQIGIVCADYSEAVRLLDQSKSLAADVARAERDVFALREEARRAGVPPGWLRP